MARIALATSAGAEARILHVAALRRADETGADLSVVHVISGSDYEAQPEELQDAIRDETEWLIRTMLHLAADRAGVDASNITIHVRTGDVTAELVDFARSTRPDSVMVGIPRKNDHSEFTAASFRELLGQFQASSIKVEKIDTN
jgi:nucleotide-binding universal stress UspA family protein